MASQYTKIARSGFHWTRPRGIGQSGRLVLGKGAKRQGCMGETSRHKIWDETTRSETTRGELVIG